jgi:DNA-binding CsgD family transcriptional regulator
LPYLPGVTVAGKRLLDRDEELKRVDATMVEAAGGEGACAVVLGPAGVGKTAFLAAVAGLAAAAGWQVLNAVAGPLEADLHWGIVRQLFGELTTGQEGEGDPLLSGAAALAAGPLGLGGAVEEAGALHGLYWLTASLAQRRPLLLIVDDAHWADGPSLRFLAYLGRRACDLPLLLLPGVRLGEAEREPLRELTSRPTTDVLRLQDLQREASEEIVRGRLPGADLKFGEACHRAAHGNPFLLHELLDELARSGVEPTAANAPRVGGVTPDSVQRTTAERLAQMARASRELAAAVAFLGEHASLSQAAALADLDATQASEAADALAAAGMLRADPPLEFVHPLLREAVYRSLPPFERGERHLRAARLLHERGAGAASVAAQLAESHPHGDRWVVEQLREAAAEALAANAAETAVRLLERALAEPPAPEMRPTVVVEAARASAAAGSPATVERLREAVEVVSEPVDRGRLLLDLGNHLHVAGRPGEAATAFERGLAEISRAETEAPSLAARLQAGWLAAARLEVPLREQATQMIREMSTTRSASNYGERALLAQVAGQLTFEGDSREDALALARLALGNGELLADDTAEGMSWITAMGALGWGDDFDGYERHLQEAFDDARARGSTIGFAAASYGINFSHYHRGLLAEAIADAQQAIAGEADGWRQFLPAARAQLGWALVERGELEEASAQADRAWSECSLQRSSMQALIGESQARVHLLRREWEEARECALEAGRIFGEALIHNPSVCPWRARAAIATARLGDREAAQELVEDALRRTRRFGAPRPIGGALIAAGLIAAGEEAERAFEEAAEVLADSPMRLEEARARVLLGASQRRAGKLRVARETLRSGLDLAAACGATLLEEQAHAELLAAGGRPRRRRSTGVDALTPAESRVCRLAMEGMSNREIAESLFVSLRTVETHLTRAYRKLAIDSRAGLQKALAGIEAEVTDP